MAKMHFLTILLAVTCFLSGVISVTDKQFEDLVAFVHKQAAALDEQSRVVEEQSIQIEKLSITVEQQSALIQHLANENKVMMKEMERQDNLINKLNSGMHHDVTNANHEEGLIQNVTIEERVSLLEIQVVEIEEDVTDLDQDVNFLFEETIIQDERIYNLEQTTIGILGDLDSEYSFVDIDGLQDTTLALDFRVTVLEQNGGSDGNSSVAELEERVETLEGTAADHETRISAVETDVDDLDEAVADHETRLTASEENIQGLQMTDVELDARITTLEETGGADPSNVTVAFHTVLTSNPTISEGSAVLFDEVLLNEGDGYDNITGTFTVPPGGDGYYYFSTYLMIDSGEFGAFNIEINGDLLCTAYNDQQLTTNDPGPATCSLVTFATQGDTVQVVYIAGIDTTPVYGSSIYYYTGFTGFKI